jgi:hypothetical protein
MRPKAVRCKTSGRPERSKMLVKNSISPLAPSNLQPVRGRALQTVAANGSQVVEYGLGMGVLWRYNRA